MPQSLSAVFLHVVLSTKDRRSYLRDKELREETHQYLGGISNGQGCIPILVGGVEDHVHVLTSLNRSVSVADYVKTIKVSSNQWIKAKVPDFAWQSGYAAFSVSIEQLSVVKHYIANQEEHHRTRSFQDEFLALLKEHDLAWDDRYVFD